MATHLNQLLAVAKGTKTQSGKSITEAYKKIQRADPWSGITSTYRPVFEDGDRYTGDTKHVQTRADEVIDGIRNDVIRMIDVQATVDSTNQLATATLHLTGDHGALHIENLPVATLLFLEKQLVDLQTFFSKMPVLDIADKWEWDTGNGVWRSETVETAKTKKIPKNHVLAQATDKHPAQVQVFMEDVVEGHWTRQKFSGAMEAEDVKDILERVRELLDAVKKAIQVANEEEVTDTEIGAQIMDFVVGDVFDR